MERNLTEETPKGSELPGQTSLSDFSVFEGIVLKQRHLMASAAGQRLHKGNDNNGHYVLSCHITDEERGYGAALAFEHHAFALDTWESKVIDTGCLNCI